MAWCHCHCLLPKANDFRKRCFAVRRAIPGQRGRFPPPIHDAEAKGGLALRRHQATWTGHLFPAIKSVWTAEPLERHMAVYPSRPVVQLIRNYRSHPEIVDATSKLIYHGKMVSGHPAGKFPADDDADRLFDVEIHRMLNGMFKNTWEHAASHSHGALWFLDLKDTFSNESSGEMIWNPTGAAAVIQLALALHNAGIHEEKTTIISMYSFQTVKIQQALLFLGRNIQARTVDSFQGAENVVVIVHFSAAFENRQVPLGMLQICGGLTLLSPGPSRSTLLQAMHRSGKSASTSASMISSLITIFPRINMETSAFLSKRAPIRCWDLSATFGTVYHRS
ncbi:AAA domain-containing protein [Boeremia exigua]|uniref:AAA domain-containing protein n=1 Tax=Boeremia exigua TaxID=749465 RepID=UPI001E8CA2CB|nr:AAA domain-containing protein [Boeremia exigua]KAH6633773.1 AAA domain-containing protein [Boeremia exigua]